MATVGARAAVGDVAAVKAALPRKVKIRGGSTAAYRPVTTTLTIVFGLGFLRRWLVDKESMPERSWWVNMAILGFMLSLIAEVNPRLGKNMAYLIMVTAIIIEGENLIKNSGIFSEVVKQASPPKPKPKVVPIPGIGVTTRA